MRRRKMAGPDLDFFPANSFLAIQQTMMLSFLFKRKDHDNDA